MPWRLHTPTSRHPVNFAQDICPARDLRLQGARPSQTRFVPGPEEACAKDAEVLMAAMIVQALLHASNSWASVFKEVCLLDPASRFVSMRHGKAAKYRVSWS